MKFQLEIQQIASTCLFKLVWNRGQQITSIVAYPQDLLASYQAWRDAYLNFYKTSLRARVPKKKKSQGKIQLPQDWHRQLVQAEAQLLTELQRWLRSKELYDIRAKITSSSSEVTLFISCDGDLARLPWETWELGSESDIPITIARSPLNIRSETTQNKLIRRRKPRILAILGDDTGLDLQGDRATLATLDSIADIQVVTWQPQQTPEVIKQQIQQALIDPQGWEILFFAGHSNETAITGGEIAIAPQISLAVTEIAPQLTIAKDNGLRFALFNSCSGLSIAKSLIDLGLSQVGVMREPIHNQVAQTFLVQFLSAIGNYQNVGAAMQAACNYLQQEQKLTYPSAYLVPSLFAHPDAELFAIEPYGWQAQLRRWLPTKSEAITIASLGLLSLLPPVDNFLLDKRTLVQSLYRDITGQIPQTNAPITLVHIDPESLAKAEITNPVPMDRSYLAGLITKLNQQQSKIIAIDYLLDLPQAGNDPLLAEAVKKGVTQNQTWFIFGAFKQVDGQEIGMTPETKIGDPNWTVQGYTDSLPNYINLLPSNQDCNDSCPFAYLVAMAHSLDESKSQIQPRLDNQSNLRSQVYQQVNSDLAFFRDSKFSSVTTFSQYFAQQWLRPIQDFSIPPDLVYNRLPAWQLLEDTQPDNLSETIILLGSGGYNEAGLTPGSDNFRVPAAISYWRTRRGLNRGEDPLTGSELLAYMTHHLLEQRLLIPIPQLWLLAIAIVLAKGLKLRHTTKPFPPKLLLSMLVTATSLTGLLSLQLYLSAVILVPWLLPATAIWIYLLPLKKIS